MGRALSWPKPLPPDLLRVKRALLFFLFASFFVPVFSQQQQIDSLLIALPGSDNEQQSQINLRLAQLYSNTNIVKALDYASQALSVTQSGNQKLTVSLYIGALYLRIGNGKKAIESYNQALQLSAENNNPEAKAKVQSALGGAYFITGNLGESLNNYLQSLRYYELKEEPGSLVNIYNGLANIYEKQNNFSKALEYNLKAITIYESSSNKLRALVGYEQIGNMYVKQGNYNKASEYLARSLRLYTDLKNVAGETSTRIQLGNINFKAGRYDEAERYYEQSLGLSKKLKMLPLEAASYNGLALTYERKRLYDKAIAAAKNAARIAQASNLKIELDIAYEVLSRLYKTTSETDKATTFQNLSKEIKDSLYNDSTLKQLADLQLRFESEKKQRQIDVQQKQQEVLASELLRERQFRNSIIAALVSVVLAFIVFIYLFTQNKRIAQSLIKQKKELEQTTREILKQKEELGQLNNVKDRFFSIISHDLRNNLTTMKLYFDLVGNPDYVPDEDNAALTKQISSSVENTIDLLENLLVWAQAQIKGVDFNPHQLDVSALVQDNINLLSGTAHHKNITLVNNTQAGLSVFADVDMINLVVRNLISNAIKFTYAGGMVNISAESKGNMVELEIADNGVGIGKESMDKMFTKTQNPTTLGTGNEKGTGLGLLLCKEFVERNGGQITVKSTEGKGSIFTVSLPLKPA